MAYKVFSNGNALNASELNTYLMAQSVISFASAAARDAALSAPIEGQLVWLEDVNRYFKYNGTSWTKLVSSNLTDKSANYAIVAADEGSVIRSTGSAITITVDNVLTQAGDRIDFIQAGAGQITFAAGSGVTLSSKGSKLKTAAQYAGCSVVFGGSGVYYLIGDLSV
jgi:hypothetical protein